MDMRGSTAGESQHASITQSDLIKDLDDKVRLSDGNIVVIAENVAFRVHKSILAQHSEVFRDILALPSSHTSDLVDGCEVVRVSDTSEDMRHFLLVLCCGRNTTFPEFSIRPYPG
ncbi:hypothetical protein L227DRAFT_309405 [Lentinus tigrinus ALCF2SS1-6]|uniref:BTB domain-containing protein n=1 Tax=Lentinus tigrinus ALCF2SS1-6 TaxID=1328759 RepID=A0A5C2RWZ9_9APHY|nr:hypothetical protein L227DRAFT_309405 [Lentinus tigrinus ALCF2SS1-6]